MLLDQLRVRLRQRFGQTLRFALLAMVTIQLTQLGEWWAAVEQDGWASLLNFIPRHLAATFGGALLVLLSVRLLAPRGAELLRHPVRFVLLLVVLSGFGALAGWGINQLLGGSVGPAGLFDVWMTALLWGSLIGWLYLLALQRSDDQERLNALLGQRALLASRLARARLNEARATIDPGEVARTLAEVHALYPQQPAAAAALLDQLIASLRLAMNRIKH